MAFSADTNEPPRSKLRGIKHPRKKSFVASQAELNQNRLNIPKPVGVSGLQGDTAKIPAQFRAR